MPENAMKTEARREESPEDIADRMWNWLLGFVYLILKIVLLLFAVVAIILFLIWASGPLVSLLLKLGKKIGLIAITSIFGQPSVSP
jgi:hypothetical protein